MYTTGEIRPCVVGFKIGCESVVTSWWTLHTHKTRKHQWPSRKARGRRADAAVPLLSLYEYGCALLCNSEKVWFNIVLHPRLRRPRDYWYIRVRSDFLGREESWPTDAHTCMGAPSEVVTKGKSLVSDCSSTVVTSQKKA